MAALCINSRKRCSKMWFVRISVCLCHKSVLHTVVAKISFCGHAAAGLVCLKYHLMCWFQPVLLKWLTWLYKPNFLHTVKSCFVASFPVLTSSFRSKWITEVDTNWGANFKKKRKKKVKKSNLSMLIKNFVLDNVLDLVVFC